jgi:DNA helicase-2/ATP-dependent DNA helicase PcrA
VTQNNLINLSEEQLSIVTSTANNIIVNAGAGAGKTRVLVERVKHLLKQGVNPTSIVVITFTNMAADELKERLAHIKGSSNCFVGTIHSYANMSLKRSGYQFEIFSEQHQDQFMNKFLVN